MLRETVKEVRYTRSCRHEVEQEGRTVRKLFDLWDKHTPAFCRVLFLLMIPTAMSDEYGTIYCELLLILWLIVRTGYEKKWDKEE